MSFDEMSFGWGLALWLGVMVPVSLVTLIRGKVFWRGLRRVTRRENPSFYWVLAVLQNLIWLVPLMVYVFYRNG
jgi:hypothetical protein